MRPPTLFLMFTISSSKIQAFIFGFLAIKRGEIDGFRRKLLSITTFTTSLFVWQRLKLLWPFLKPRKTVVLKSMTNSETVWNQASVITLRFLIFFALLPWRLLNPRSPSFSPFLFLLSSSSSSSSSFPRSASAERATVTRLSWADTWAPEARAPCQDACTHTVCALFDASREVRRDGFALGAGEQAPFKCKVSQDTDLSAAKHIMKTARL